MMADAIFPALVDAHPDAVLLEACKRFPATFRRYADECHADGDAADLAHTAVVNAIDANTPQIWAGLVAKARAGAVETGSGGYGERWPEEIGPDLLRLLDAGKLSANIHPDADLIAACAIYPDRLDAFNNSDEWDGPDQAALDEVTAIIENARPSTVAGMVAKAKAARAEAAGGGGWESSRNDADAWARHLVDCLIGLADAGGSVPGSAP